MPTEGYYGHGGEWVRKDEDTGEDFEGRNVRAPQVWVANANALSFVFNVGEITYGGEVVTLVPVEVNMTTAGPTTAVAADATKRIYVVGYKLSPDLNTHLEWLSAATVVLNPEALSPRVQYGGMFLPSWLMRTEINEALRLQQTDDGAAAPATIRGVVWYFKSAS